MLMLALDAVLPGSKAFITSFSPIVAQNVYDGRGGVREKATF